jgi:hypothetical protein
MRRGVFRTSTVLILSFVMTLLIQIYPVYASDQIKCGTGFGQKVPVLMVHGFNSNADMWRGSGSMSEALKGIGEIQLSYFDYSAVNSQWVTNQAIGPNLAKTIDCLSQTSLKEGGRGKVVVVGHSMGGLATRYAASQVVDGRKVADEIGLVITLGTPHLGSLLGNIGTTVAMIPCRAASGVLLPGLGVFVSPDLCLANMAVKGLRVGSRELQELPVFPSKVPVRSIAGDTKFFMQYFFTDLVKEHLGDLVVGASSALSEATAMGRGDGEFKFGCDYRSYTQDKVKKFQGGQCTHTEMYKTGYIQDSVKNGIKEYLAVTSRLPVPSGRLVTLFDRLTMTYADVWGDAQSMPGEVENIVDYSQCKDIVALCPHIFFINLDSKAQKAVYGGNLPVSLMKQGCAVSLNLDSSRVQLTRKDTLKAGGVELQHYEQTCTISPSEVKKTQYWYSENKRVLITAADSPKAKFSPEILQAVLENISWK